MIFLHLISLSLFGVIAYQDFKQRQINLIYLFLLFLLALIINYAEIMLTLHDFVQNIIFLFFILIILNLYYSIKKRKFVNTIDSYIGSGDILFFVACAPLFSLANFIFFFTLGILFSLVLYLVFRKIISSDDIPLAGFFSCFTALLMLYHITFNTYLLYGF